MFCSPIAAQAESLQKICEKNAKKRTVNRDFPMRSMRMGAMKHGPLALFKSILILVAAYTLLIPNLGFAKVNLAAKHGLAGRRIGSRELRVARFSDLNPAAEATREAAVEAIKAVPFTPAPGDFFGGAVWIFIVPFFIGVFIVYLVTVFKPDAILTDDQMIEYKKAEKQYFLEKRGAVKDPDAPAEMNRAQRRAARNLKGKRRVRS